MALDRWIALVFVALCCVYGYAAFFTMDHLLPPFMQRNPVWPSTFPKILSIGGAIVGLIVLLGIEKAPAKDGAGAASDMTIARLGEYKLGQAALLVGLMIVYAMALRPVGFIASTTVFLVAGSFILGERKFHVMIPVALIAAGFIWYLVEGVLGIFLRPLPAFLG